MPNPQTVIEIGWESVATLGVAGAVISAASSWLTSHLSSRWIEKYKSTLNAELEKIKHSLKREELLFERDFLAANDWYQIKLKIFPRYMIDPDFEEMLDSVSLSIGSISSDIYSYLGKHGPLLPKEMREKLSGIAFSMGSEEHRVFEDRVSTKESRELVNELYDYFPIAEETLNQRVRLTGPAA
ncbi:MAG: hypothetical protein ABL882_01350 [Sphingopyxis sp.]